MDFVVGYEIKLSGNHNCKGVPAGRFSDICDTLAGKYPKDFKWTGWHPNCRCYKIPILKTEEEFWEWDGRSEVTTESVNEVKDVPDEFKQWVKDNKARIDRAGKRGTLPYFVKDNRKKVEGMLKGIKENSDADSTKGKILSVLSDIKRQGFSRISPFKIGGVEKRMSDFAIRNGIELGSEDVYMSASAIAHATRDSKQAKGLVVSDADLVEFPIKREQMDLYYDTKTRNFTYTDGKNKYIIHPSYEIKMPEGKRKIVNFVTASKQLDKYEFRMDKYKKIE